MTKKGEDAIGGSRLIETWDVLKLSWQQHYWIETIGLIETWDVLK